MADKSISTAMARETHNLLVLDRSRSGVEVFYATFVLTTVTGVLGILAY